MYSSQSLLILVLARACFVFAKEITEVEGLTTRSKHCVYERVYDMYGAHCVGLSLAKVPSLRGGIEILDFSKNRLRRLQSDTLSSYTSLKHLYLSENYIRHIDEDALTSLTDLRTLDLSMNAMTQIPESIFQLPSLRKLYLSGNSLTYLDGQFTTLRKPIKAPLELIDFSDCEMTELPDLGVLPELILFNISQNPLINIEPKVFAQACNLAKVDMTGSIDNIKLCSLRPIITWFEEKHIYFKLEDYSRLKSKEFANCPIEDISEALNATHHRCKSQYLQVQSMKSSSRSMMTIIGGLAGFLVGFILLLYLTHRWNVSRLERTEKKTAPPHDGDKQVTAILLNNVS